MSNTIKKMVALGSSYAAGPGIKPQVDLWARRSSRNYAHLVSQALGADLIDSTVSGATTGTILEVPQRVLWHRFSPQIDVVSADVDLVTVTAGGNDVSYFGEIARLVTANWLAARPATHRLGMKMRQDQPLRVRTAEELEATATGLQRIVEECRRRAPRARIVLVDYVPLFDSESAPGGVIPLRSSEIRHVRDVAAALSRAFATASQRTGADLVPASAHESGHAVGSPHPHAIGLARGRGEGFVFHPSAAGMHSTAQQILRLVDPAATISE